MKNDIEKIMGELARGSDRIIVNPKTLEDLKNQGIPYDVVPSPTVDELFDQRREKAKVKAPHLPTLPQGLPPSIQALYQEIRECIFFGLNGAAITMASILIEYVIKHTTFIKESGGYKDADPKKWDEFENMELSPAITTLYPKVFKEPWKNGFNNKAFHKSIDLSRDKQVEESITPENISNPAVS